MENYDDRKDVPNTRELNEETLDEKQKAEEGKPALSRALETGISNLPGITSENIKLSKPSAIMDRYIEEVPLTLISTDKFIESDEEIIITKSKTEYEEFESIYLIDIKKICRKAEWNDKQYMLYLGHELQQSVQRLTAKQRYALSQPLIRQVFYLE
jgi:hypothetical protein